MKQSKSVFSNPIFLITVILVAITIAFFCVTTVRFFAFRSIVIQGDSMLPTLSSGQQKYVNTAKKIRLNDVVVFYKNNDDNDSTKTAYFSGREYLRCMPFFGKYIEKNPETPDIYVKRVVGKEGDVIELKAVKENGINFVFLYRNGQKIQENIVMLNLDDIDQTTAEYGQKLRDEYGDEGVQLVRPTAPFTVPSGCFYVLGDNRDGSTDSRNFGAVSKDYFLGVVNVK